MDYIQEILPDMEQIEQYVKSLTPDMSFSAKELFFELLQGKWDSLEACVGFLLQYIRNYLTEWRQVFLTIVSLFVISAIAAACADTVKSKGTGKMCELFFQLSLMLELSYVWKQMMGIVTGGMQSVIEFLKLAIPGYMICLAATGTGITAAAFYKLLLGFVCLLEGGVLSMLLPAVEFYMMLGFLESLMDEKRLLGMMRLIKKGILLVLKGFTLLFGGSGMLQMLVLPAIDREKQTLIRKTVAAIPGVGDVADSLSGVLVASAMTVKNCYGVVILFVLIFAASVPLISLGMMLLLLHVSLALGGITGARKLEDTISYCAQAGDLLFRIFFTFTGIYFIAIAALIASTGGK